MGSPSDGSDGVIEAGSALGGVKNTRFILLEDELVGFNGDTDNSFVDGSLESGWVISLDECVA